MFQYAFARSLQEKLGQDILIDWHHVIESNKREPGIGYKNSLQDFNVKPFNSIDISAYKENMNLFQFLAFRKYEKTFPFSGDIVQKEKFEKEFLNEITT